MKRGRPIAEGLPVEIVELRLWGKRGTACAVPVRVLPEPRRQLEFPFECLLPLSLQCLPPLFPDPSRQSCFQVRHD